jgi:uncharacterized protein (DUF433 family)
LFAAELGCILIVVQYREPMMTDNLIVLDPAILMGKPIIRGTRISVEFVIGLLADGWSVSDILASYPNLSQQDITACLSYARELLSSERVYPAA